MQGLHPYWAVLGLLMKAAAVHCSADIFTKAISINLKRLV